MTEETRGGGAVVGGLAMLALIAVKAGPDCARLVAKSGDDVVQVAASVGRAADPGVARAAGEVAADLVKAGDAASSAGHLGEGAANVIRHADLVLDAGGLAFDAATLAGLGEARAESAALSPEQWGVDGPLPDLAGAWCAVFETKRGGANAQRQDRFVLEPTEGGWAWRGIADVALGSRAWGRAELAGRLELDPKQACLTLSSRDFRASDEQVGVRQRKPELARRLDASAQAAIPGSGLRDCWDVVAADEQGFALHQDGDLFSAGRCE